MHKIRYYSQVKDYVLTCTDTVAFQLTHYLPAPVHRRPDDTSSVHTKATNPQWAYEYIYYYPC